MAKLFGRGSKWIAKALLSPRHYRAMVKMGLVFNQPLRAYGNYISRGGHYPDDYSVRTPIGDRMFTLYSVEDLLTLNEVFARNDYKADARDRVVVDFGSNIGISIGYFLTRCPQTFVYGYEPVPRNVTRLRRNLGGLEGRYSLSEHAVGTGNGRMKFGVEESGRYGGLGIDTGAEIEVNCINSNDVLDSILSRHDRIDILKADIEGYENKVLSAIPNDILKRINKVYVEWQFTRNPLPETHRFRQYGTVAQFWRNAH
jgi:FkbM family methyltransferase